ncbi:helix-turn-helix domain-containing protein [Lunatibacter salilacus]|uniref:helix-turn-helix domain-containing protein n=1 Tax=Lunatibacter salilacus TaxID=2483804 RepID=UPI00131BDFC9|nr:helix-turn-helix domain-containing protein [Lunatibacter salilacus]
MVGLGEAIRRLREEKGLPLRTVAAYLDIDQAILSKMERGKRNASREQVIKLAEYFKVKERELLLLWLSDKLLYAVAEEALGYEALQVAEEKLGYMSRTKLGLPTLISTIEKVLEKDGRVAAAWLYGSMASEEANPESDVDLIIEFNTKKKYSMFDLLDIAHAIENQIDRKVDIVEKGQLRDFVLRTASDSLLKIYE